MKYLIRFATGKIKDKNGFFERWLMQSRIGYRSFFTLFSQIVDVPLLFERYNESRIKRDRKEAMQ